MAKKQSIVLYPAPGMGHIVSMVELGKLILSRYSHRFSITILLTTGCMDTPATTSFISHVSRSHPSISFLRFPLVHLELNPPRSRAAVDFDFLRRNSPNVSQALKDLSETTTLRAFVIDLFCTSALGIGKEMEIPTYYFFTSGAAILAAFLYLPKIHELASETTSFKDLFDVVLEYPGIMPPLKAHHMPEPMLDRADPAYWDMLYFCSHLAKSNGIIVNTFDGLEPIPIKALADGVCGTIPPVYCIGPLIAEAKEKPSEKEEENEDCLAWLDKQPSRSVVFLCFGSRGTFSTKQIREIANGVEKSGQRFLWVVKKPVNDDKNKQIIVETTGFDWNDGVFPEGFLERTRERGMVVKSWAPQVEVLRKEAVGGFVTHCGWNSVLEAVVAGVPMVAWPLYAEQHMNRNVMVEDLRMAIGVEQREEDGFVNGDEVERRIREMMESDKGRVIGEQCLKMKELASAAWGEFGTSRIALEKFVESIGCDTN